MKILLATTQFGPEYGQGADRYLTTLAEGLRARGHQALVLAGDPRKRRDHAAFGAHIADGPVIHWPSTGWMTVRGRHASRVRTLLRKERPDVVHLASPAHVGVGLVDVAQALDCPVVLTLVDYWWWCPRQTLHHGRGHTCPGDVGWRDCLACVAVDHDRAWFRWLGQSALARSALLPATFLAAGLARGLHPGEIGTWRSRSRVLKSVLERAQAIIVPSRTMEQRVRQTVSHDRVWFVPYGLERARVAERGAAGPRVKRRNGGGLTLGYAGVLEPHKGLHVLLDSLRRLIGADFRLRVAGAGTSERYRRELLRLSEGLPVSFLGRLDDAELARFYRELDVLIVPSLWPENRPFVVLEALATGCPVIASDVPGIAELLLDPHCLFTPGSAADLAERLRGWLEAGAAPIGDISARRVRDELSTADEMVERTLSVYAAAGAAQQAG